MWPIAVISTVWACLGPGARPMAPGPGLVADCWMKGGCEQRGDFDGDGVPDVALSVRSLKSGRRGILLRLGSGQTMAVGVRHGTWMVIDDDVSHREAVPDLEFLTNWHTMSRSHGDRLYIDGGDSATTLDIRGGRLVLEYLGF